MAINDSLLGTANRSLPSKLFGLLVNDARHSYLSGRGCIMSVILLIYQVHDFNGRQVSSIYIYLYNIYKTNKYCRIVGLLKPMAGYKNFSSSFVWRHRVI
jgi:hypothetical protein